MTLVNSIKTGFCISLWASVSTRCMESFKGIGFFFFFKPCSNAEPMRKGLMLFHAALLQSPLLEKDMSLTILKCVTMCCLLRMH